jgi:ABC-type transport system involved in cytochrome bd biosynthesis fused ATPase/permease subunit
LAAGLLRAHRGTQSVPDLGRVSALLLPAGFIPGTLGDHLEWERLSAGERRRMGKLAAELGLGGKLDRDPATMSQGEQRRAQLLLALAKDADFYLLDEPLSNVDEASREAVMSTIFEATRGRALVVIMHGDDRFRDWFDCEVRLPGSAPEQADEPRPAPERAAVLA